MTIQQFSRMTPGIGFVLVLAFTVIAYWPGLHGGYLFDDYPNLVDNKDLQITNIGVPDLVRAALSSPASELKRPLASLSFAINYYFAGLDPFWMKLTNLLIHLLNGVLIYALTIRLINAANAKQTIHQKDDPRWIALLVTAGWLLLPINLTGVLYVVQRMESLANLFVLLGLYGYVRARQQMQDSEGGFAVAITALALSTAAGLLSKETAVMTPLYALLIECTLFHGQSAARKRDYRVIGLFMMVLFIPLVIGLSWQLPRILNAGAWATRNFDLPQRLMTEARIVVDYIQWTLLPTPQTLSFYHDDYPISLGWLSPWTTLLCALMLAALVIFAVLIRKRAPLVTLGIALFIGAHLLTATILPLELVYEHRNYFASFGLLLALIPILSADILLPMQAARRLLLAGLLCLWAISTASTAVAWGSPLILAQTLARRAPDSPRAQYGLGYAYIALSKYAPKSPFAEAAYIPLETAMKLPAASILPEQALIIMSARMQLPIKNEWWASLTTKLQSRKTTIQDEGALESLVNCVEQKKCTLDPDHMLRAFLAALTSYPNPSARLLAIYGGYCWNMLEDHQLGQDMLTEAVRIAPHEAPYRITLARMLIAKKQIELADQQIAILESMNVGHHLDAELSEIAQRKSKVAAD